MGYALAGFTTFVAILGRYSNQQRCDEENGKQGIDSCCSVLEQDSTQRFVPNLKTTFTNFASGFKRLFRIRRQTGMKTILKSSLVIMVTAESACILTAETVDLIFYQYSILLSVPLALIAGAFTVVAPGEPNSQVLTPELLGHSKSIKRHVKLLPYPEHPRQHLPQSLTQ